MKRTRLIRHLTRQGCRLKREGGNHSVYENPADGSISAVPRHAEIAEVLLRKICAELHVPGPTD